MSFKPDPDISSKSRFRFWNKSEPSDGTYGALNNDLNFFNRVSLEITKIGNAPILYKCFLVEHTQVDPVFGDSSGPTYAPPVEIFCSRVPANILLQLMIFGLSQSNEDFNVAVNAKHFLEKTNGREPQNGDKVMDEQGRVYKITNVVRNSENVFYGGVYTFLMQGKLSDGEGF